MLLQFTVENFLSFRDAATLSMLAADDVEHAEQQIGQGPGGRKVLRCAAIYGANASGKSNLIRALDFALGLVRDGTKSTARIGTRPFKLDSAKRSAPSRFQFELGERNIHYSYGFEVTQEKVQSEWLFLTEGGNERCFFRRLAAGENAAPAIEFDAALPVDAERRKFLGFVAEGTRPNQLFLTEAHAHNVTELGGLLNALNVITIIWPRAPYRGLTEALEGDPTFHGFMVELLKKADTGIEDLEVKHSETDLSPFYKEFIEFLPRGEMLPSEDTGAIRRTDADKIEIARIMSAHRSSTGELIKFRFGEESDGTRRLLHLGPALHLASKEGRGFAVDELERSLHPLLTQLFLRRFFDVGRQAEPSQLIFTTHDTNLLDLSLLSRDSIWFTERDDSGASSLYSLAEFKPEQLKQLGNSLEEGYLRGRFGAIPFFGDPVRLSWTRKGGS